MPPVENKSRDEMYESISAFFKALAELTKLGTKLLKAEIEKKRGN